MNIDETIAYYNNMVIEDNISDEELDAINEQLQQELFALPFSTYEVADMEGMKLYSSDTLKRKYVEAMRKSDKCKAVGNDIQRLVDKKTIVPAWMNKGIFRLTLFKVFAPRGNQSILGFYTKQHDQIYLLIDNNITFGFASNKHIADLTMHEAMHMCCSHIRWSFVSMFKAELMKYYTQVMKDIFQTDKNDISKEIQKYYFFLFREFEFKNLNTVDKFLVEYYKLMDALFRSKTTLKSLDFDKRRTDLMNFIKLYFNDINRFIASVRQYMHIYRPLVNGYLQGLRQKEIRSLCVQELFFPSEVICVYSESGDLSKIYKAFKKI